MARQDNLPPIWGKGWNPAVHLEFSTPLKVSDARQKMMLEVAQQLDGHLRVFAFIWDEMTSEVEQWDGEDYPSFLRYAIEKYKVNVTGGNETQGLSSLINKQEQKDQKGNKTRSQRVRHIKS